MITPKDVVYGLLRRTGLTELARRRDRAAVFCFHNVVPDDMAGLGDDSLHLRLGSFRAIVDFVARAFDVVPLEELGARLRAGRPLGRLAAFTFDDAYAGVFRYALPLLAERSLPSTVFVVPEKADAPAAFWWDALAERGQLDARRRRESLLDLRGDERLILNGTAGGSRLPAALLPAAWDEVRAAPGPACMGSHTLRHLNLTALGTRELERDLAASRERLSAALDRECNLVSYPYGLFDGGVVRAAAAAGYAVGTTMRYGLVNPGADSLALPRVNVPAGVDVDALDSWSVGWRLRKPA